MSKENPGALRRLWRTLKQPSAKYSLLALLVIGFISGIVFWGGFNTAIEATNSIAFCTSCHEMRDNPYPEYKDSIHYKNKVGVRATCPDCHVPKDWTHKMIRKAKASMEVWGKITGSIDTRKKFEANRFRLAKQEWARMEANHSQECRNCHSWDAMDPDTEGETIYNKHMAAEKAGKSCIDCHKGIAHHLPREYRDPDE